MRSGGWGASYLHALAADFEFARWHGDLRRSIAKTVQTPGHLMRGFAAPNLQAQSLPCERAAQAVSRILRERFDFRAIGRFRPVARAGHGSGEGLVLARVLEMLNGLLTRDRPCPFRRKAEHEQQVKRDEVGNIVGLHD